MRKEQFILLIDKYLAGLASVDEEQQLTDFFNSFKPDEEWDEQVLGVKKALQNKMLRRLMQSVRHKQAPPEPAVRPVRLWWYIAAASVAIFVITGTYLFSLSRNITPLVVKKTSLKKHVIAPGGNKAYLKLADGSTIVLDQASNGVLAQQGNTIIRKTKDGKVVYIADPSGKASKNTFNTITTPKGGQYQLTLPDGTEVWLNAATSLTFPAVFDPGERKVTLSGEAYFEVAKLYAATLKTSAKVPFRVNTGNSQVEVLGTHFNVMAYPDAQQEETTLLEGSVAVRHGSVVQDIAPGQQASVALNGIPTIKVSQVNTEAVMAWKEGLFVFDNTGIDDAMQQIKRWYDAEVIYEGVKPDVEFTGVLPRSSDVRLVLQALESAKGVKFTLAGNKIIVQKK